MVHRRQSLARIEAGHGIEIASALESSESTIESEDFLSSYDDEDSFCNSSSVSDADYDYGLAVPSSFQALDHSPTRDVTYNPRNMDGQPIIRSVSRTPSNFNQSDASSIQNRSKTSTARRRLSADHRPLCRTFSRRPSVEKGGDRMSLDRYTIHCTSTNQYENSRVGRVPLARNSSRRETVDCRRERNSLDRYTVHGTAANTHRRRSSGLAQVQRNFPRRHSLDLHSCDLVDIARAILEENALRAVEDEYLQDLRESSPVSRGLTRRRSSLSRGGVSIVRKNSVQTIDYGYDEVVPLGCHSQRDSQRRASTGGGPMRGNFPRRQSIDVDNDDLLAIASIVSESASPEQMDRSERDASPMQRGHSRFPSIIPASDKSLGRTRRNSIHCFDPSYEEEAFERFSTHSTASSRQGSQQRRQSTGGSVPLPRRGLPRRQSVDIDTEDLAAVASIITENNCSKFVDEPQCGREMDTHQLSRGQISRCPSVQETRNSGGHLSGSEGQFSVVGGSISSKFQRRGSTGSIQYHLDEIARHMEVISLRNRAIAQHHSKISSLVSDMNLDNSSTSEFKSSISHSNRSQSRITRRQSTSGVPRRCTLESIPDWEMDATVPPRPSQRSNKSNSSVSSNSSVRRRGSDMTPIIPGRTSSAINHVVDKFKMDSVSTCETSESTLQNANLYRQKNTSISIKRNSGHLRKDSKELTIQDFIKPPLRSNTSDDSKKSFSAMAG